MKIYQECCYPPVSTLDLTWENSGSLYWLKVEGEYFLFGRGLLAEAVWSEWWPPFSPGRQRFSAKQNVLSVRGQGGAGGHTRTFYNGAHRSSIYLSPCLAVSAGAPRIFSLSRHSLTEPARPPRSRSPSRPPSCSLSGPPPGRAHKIPIFSFDLLRVESQHLENIKLANILDCSLWILFCLHKYTVCSQLSDRSSIWSLYPTI